MLHLLYIFAFTLLAVIAIANMIRNLVTIATDSGRHYHSSYGSTGYNNVPHPEFLDTEGKLINEPLLVMRSINVEDARDQLDALYDSSPSYRAEASDD